MATSSIGGYNVMAGVNAQNQILQSMDMSKLTGGSFSTADSATLSKTLSSEYTNYQNMLTNVGRTASASGANGGVGSVSNGVGLDANGMFDFKSYITTYFPNFSEEEVERLSAMYTESYNKMYEQIGGAMDMSKLAGMVLGTDGETDTSAILKQTAEAAKKAGENNSGFDVSDYISSYFPNLSSKQVTSLTNSYQRQYSDLTKA